MSRPLCGKYAPLLDKMVDDLARNIDVICIYEGAIIPCRAEMQVAGQTLRIRVYHVFLWDRLLSLGHTSMSSVPVDLYPVRMSFTPVPLIDELWIINTKTGLGVSYRFRSRGVVTIMPIEFIIDLQRWLF